MMYQRTDLTLSMFYASSADAEGNKVATLTMQVIAAEAGSVQTSQLRCITDTAAVVLTCMRSNPWTVTRS